MAELRKAQRVTTKQQGTIRVPGRPDIMCTLRNLSSHGAQLNFGNPTILPRSF
jgi:hypothetical protein